MASAVKIYNHFETPRVEGVYHRLICLTGDDKGKAYFLLGKRIVLGRSEKCDVTVLDLKSSREHAEIILVGNDYILTDLQSQNGIMVNDLKVKQHTLADGDKIIIGKTVYKFSRVEVKDVNKKKKAAAKTLQKVDDGFYDKQEKEPQNKRLTLTLSLVILLALVILFADDSGDGVTRKQGRRTTTVREIDESFLRAIKSRNLKDKKTKEKLAKYIKRGRREYREGNYFRAISQFESALQILPNDSLANFYLRKAREKLDEQIEDYFSKAIRDADAVNYAKAVTSYCAVIRLLNRYKTDERYKTAKEGITNLEKKMGMEEGEIVCVEEDMGL